MSYDEPMNDAEAVRLAADLLRSCVEDMGLLIGKMARLGEALEQLAQRMEREQ